MKRRGVFSGMRRRGVFKQLLLFCLVGFVVTTLYNTLLVQIPIENGRHIEQPLLQTTLSTTIPSPRKTPPIDCRKILEYDKAEIDKATIYMKKHPPVRLKDEDFIKLSKDCVLFRRSMRYDTYTVTSEEIDFPIAFSILTYKDVDQTERLLRAIYRPHNFYCIHVDLTSPPVVHKALRSISQCFGNVFIVSKTEDIIYNHMSRLKADLNCMSDLLSLSQKWKYFINLPHQEFPLKTNLEMVKILKIYNGANDIEGIISPGRMMSKRFERSYKYVNNTWKDMGEKKTKPPYNASIVKGSAYGVFSRQFVHYILKSKEAEDILKYMEDVKSPDEYYWATLNHNKGLKAPGRYLDNPEKKPWNAVYAAWGGRDRCHGKFIRGVCVFGIGDLNELASKKELFANKFYADYQYLALDCLEEYIYNKTFHQLVFESFYYNQLPFTIKD